MAEGQLMIDAAQVVRADQWGTARWFQRRFSDGDANDPTAYFSHSVNGYQVFRHRSISRWLRTALQGSTPRSLLDVGCGTGVLTALLAQEHAVARAVGIDFVADAVQEAKARYPDLEFSTGALPELDFPEASFDLVVASEVLYYLAAGSREAAVAEIVRVLQPGGRLLFTARLGGRYFELTSALSLIGADLEVEQQGFLHNRIYELAMRPLRAGRILAETSSRGSSESRPEYARLSQRAGRLLHNPVSRVALAGVAQLERPLLRSSRLPAICHVVGRVVCPTISRSNVMLLARKK